MFAYSLPQPTDEQLMDALRKFASGSRECVLEYEYTNGVKFYISKEQACFIAANFVEQYLKLLHKK